MMVIASVLVLIFRLSGDASYLASIITAVGGAWGGLRAGILLKLYGSTSDQAAAYHLRLDRIQRFFIANSACENRNQGTQGRLKEVVETRGNDTQISQEHGNRHMDELTKKYILTRTLPNASMFALLGYLLSG